VKDLDEAGVRTAVLLRPPAPAVALRYAAGQLAALLGGLPLALWGLLTHALPYWLTWVAARVLRPEGDVEATAVKGLLLDQVFRPHPATAAAVHAA